MKSTLITKFAFGLVLAAFTASAAPIVFVLGPDPVHDYRGEDVGPYQGTLTNTDFTGFFCLDESLGSTFGKRYTGTEALPMTQQEQEAAFLAALGLHLGSQVSGPISFAIWEIMNTTGKNTVDPAAEQYIRMAEYAYAMRLICSSILDQSIIFTPSDTTVQRFITAVPCDAQIAAAFEAVAGSSSLSANAPEGSTLWMGISGLGLLSLHGVRQRRSKLPRPF